MGPNVLLNINLLESWSLRGFNLYKDSWWVQQALATLSIRVVTINLLPRLVSGKAHLIVSHDIVSHKSSTTIKYLWNYFEQIMHWLDSCNYIDESILNSSIDSEYKYLRKDNPIRTKFMNSRTMTRTTPWKKWLYLLKGQSVGRITKFVYLSR